MDLNSNATKDGAERGQAAIRVHLYEDTNGNGVIDAGERRIQTTQTRADGSYTFSFGGPATNYTVERRLYGSNNDAEQRVSNGAMDLTSSDLELIRDGGNDQVVGLRFNNLLIPQGATITSATITFEADEAHVGATNLTLRGQAHDNAPAFTTAVNNISTRATTTASVAWNTVPSFVIDNTYTSPDVSTIVQEIVNRAGWVTGNEMVFVVSGTGTRVAEAYDGEMDATPYLQVQYSMPATALTTYIVQVETADLSPGATLTSPGTVAISFPSASGHTRTARFAYNGETTACYGIADSDDSVWLMNRFSGENFRIGIMGTGNVEAMAVSLDRNTVYAMNGGQLGTINVLTGAFTSLPSPVGNGDGVLGTFAMNDIDGLTVDQLTGIVWGSLRRNSPDADLLININPTTGQIIQDAFGPGVDYVPISGGLPDLDDFTVDPFTGIMYGTNSDGGTGTQLVTIDKTTGAMTVIGPLGIGDVEGFGATDCGDLYATTGEGGTLANQNSLWTVSKATGAASLVGLFGQGTQYSPTDFEASSCLFSPANRINGRVYDDLNNNTVDDGEPGLAGIDVQLYQDNNNDGAIDGGDVLLQTATTDGAGDYFFDLASVQGNYVIQTDGASYPVGYTLTTDNVEEQDYPTCTVGQIFTGKTFGLRDIPLAQAGLIRLRYQEAEEHYPFVWTTLEPCIDFTMEYAANPTQWQPWAADHMAYNHEQRYILNPATLPQVAPGYYRVRAVTTNGQTQYSNTVLVGQTVASSLSLAATHYTEGTLQLWGTWQTETEPLTLKIVDSKGTLVYTHTLSTEDPTHLRIALPQALAQGVYLCSLQQQGSQAQHRVVVLR